MHGIKRKQWTKELLRQKRVQDEKKIYDYRSLTENVLNMRDEKIYSIEALKKTSELLEKNPEFNAIWNYRRDIIASLASELKTPFWDKELVFVMMLLKDYPKVYWIWNHRLWVLKHYPTSSPKVWQTELAVVNKLLEQDARNYHGWHYRRIVVGNIESITNKSLDKEEFEYTTIKINNNISNYSAWHQRVQIISRMFQKGEVGNQKEYIRTEISYIINAMFTDAEDQSVWFYIKWFIKNDIVCKTLDEQEYLKMLKDLRENILLINNDEIEFSGKQNIWCLKILLVLEDILEEKEALTERSSEQYLVQLIDADPLRKNRYLHLLEQHK
ncbi:BAL_1a_G0028950.mRNA.1.CDS.1 [Saccharomyces cerevisiae]|nr:BAL_1a_G0028950.mRNA.1.CDS.1 [Saccharomyces cerevisiae]CAI7174772.1 BAL_1a_G0028950.mRNA.1.CDS.1 [Saccharomyces cerevisiae]